VNLADLIASHARNRPTDPALVEDGQTITCIEAEQRVSALAGWLHELGVRAGSVVGLCLRDSADHVLMHFAVARLAAVILPMDHRWSSSERHDVARAFGASVVIHEPGAEPLAGIRCAFLEAGASLLPAVLPAPPSDPSQPLLISLSSGTTGRPKGALVTHGQMYERFVNQWVTLSLNMSDRFICVTPLYFGAARSFCMSALAAGGVVILDPPPHDPGELAAAINRSAATVCFLVPTQMRRLLEDAPEDGGLLFPWLRLLIFGGSIVGADEALKIRGRLTPNLASYYATSEGGGISVLHPREFAEHGDTVGRGTFRVEVEVVDEHDQALPRYEVGRLRFRGPGVATVFLDEDGVRQHSPAGWFYPGDLGSLDSAGFISLRGREKDLINRGGINVYPAEIERVLAAHPAVREAAVTGRPSAVHGEEVAAFVVAATPVGSEELLSWCKARLAPYKLPREIHFVPELPKTNFGKVRKSELAAHFSTNDNAR
jgi:acyl-CoA synthetase (AMP-forming)/AMP-acid ligase II